MKRIPIHVYFTPEELEIVKRYAAADNRTLSNLAVHAIKGIIARNKKSDHLGRIEVVRVVANED